MPKVCPVAAQVIAFKNDGAVCLLLGVFILLQDIQIIYELLHVCYYWFPTLWCLVYVGFGGS